MVFLFLFLRVTHVPFTSLSVHLCDAWIFRTFSFSFSPTKLIVTLAVSRSCFDAFSMYYAIEAKQNLWRRKIRAHIFLENRPEFLLGYFFYGLLFSFRMVRDESMWAIKRTESIYTYKEECMLPSTFIFDSMNRCASLFTDWIIVRKKRGNQTTMSKFRVLKHNKNKKFYE